MVLQHILHPLQHALCLCLGFFALAGAATEPPEPVPWLEGAEAHEAAGAVILLIF